MSYRVQVRPSGHRFTVHADETLLNAALRQGIALPYGCRSGFCGSCKGRIVEGEVAYANDYPALTPDEHAQGLALFCQAMPVSDLVIESGEVEAPGEVRIRRMPCKIARMQRLSHDVMAVFLKLPEAQRLQFFAGQYLDVLLNDGSRRSFSIANAPHNDELIELHVRHVPGGNFTDHIFHGLREGDIWRVEAPLGTFCLREDSERAVLMMGGGTGFGPLKGMLEHAFYVDDQRPFHLYWGVRAQRDLYCAELPRRWQEQHVNFHYTPVLSEPDPQEMWRGATGLVHDQVLKDHPDLSDFDIYMSGPPAMIEVARVAFLQHGANAQRMFSDAFEYNSRAAGSD